jgi:DNA-binding NtrC family response regulator
MVNPKILVIDDDDAHREGMVMMLEDEGYEIDSASSGETAIGLIDKNFYDLVITDYKMQGIDGMELLKLINDRNPLLKVIMVTGFGTFEHAVQAIHLGAIDYIPKPVDPKKLKLVIKQTLELMNVESEKIQQIPKRFIHFGEIVGKSKSIRNVISKINEISDIDVPVLIYGESGTGKELVARAIHKASGRKNNPMIAVNTGAIAKELILSELFGHEKGAFTGAIEQKKGKFEEADSGTLFLDEISTMGAEVQIALLRVLENHTIDRVGGKKTMPVDVRIVAATNEDLQKCIENKTFREDLFYRLNVYSIEIPPLRDRVEDIPLLCEHFIHLFNKEYKREIEGIDEESLGILKMYTWPGNVRELRNIILRAMISGKKEIKKKNLPQNILKGGTFEDEIRVYAGTSLPEIERISIIKTLKKVKGNKQKAAELLDISRRSLYNKLEDYKIEENEYTD